jgi:photosynthetic reaction center H subunit
MPTGYINDNFDVASIAINTFWLFFFGLIVYLRREEKREGYPLLNGNGVGTTHGLFPATPPKKTYLLADGSKLTLPREPAERNVALKQLSGGEGAPFAPTGNPLRDAVGPASYAGRQDHTDDDWEGHPRIVPLRVAKGYSLEARDPDPRGYAIVAADGKSPGTVKEVWIDRAEPQVYYYEASIAGGTVLVPARLAIINETAKQLQVASITAAQFADAPRIKNPDQVTLLEEDKISGYFGGGHLFATPERQEPFV